LFHKADLFHQWFILLYWKEKLLFFSDLDTVLVFTECLNRSSFCHVGKLISLFVTQGWISAQGNWPYSARRLDFTHNSDPFWFPEIFYFILSMHCPLDVISINLFKFSSGGKPHCRSSLWCHGPDGFSMWWSQQTTCYGLPGVHHYKLSKNIFSYSLDTISYCSLLMQPAEIVGLVDIPSHIRFWGIDSGIRHRLVVYHCLPNFLHTSFFCWDHLCGFHVINNYTFRDNGRLQSKIDFNTLWSNHVGVVSLKRL